MLSGQVAALVAAAGPDQARAIAAVVERVAEARGIDVVLAIDGRRVEPDSAVAAVDVDVAVIEEHGPWLPGFVREALVSAARRRSGGVHHTRPGVARVIASMALDGHDPTDVMVGDPAVGGGAFLLAAADVLAPHSSAEDVVGRLHGQDVDPLAAATTVAALGLWAGRPVGAARVSTADFLVGLPFDGVAVDVMVGNPPFLGQLKHPTARAAGRARLLRDRWPDIGGYVDDAALFLLAALEAVRPGGTVGLLQPVSVLSARDATPVRQRILDAGAVEALWFDGARVFDAEVDTCALVVRSGAVPRPVRRRVGVAGEATTDGGAIADAASWAGLVSDLIGVPALTLPESGARLGDVANCTAGFRDEFYGLREAVSDDPTGELRLVTSGLIDPLDCGWGRRICRYDGRRWNAPSVDIDLVDPDVKGWVGERLRPKVVVASQTRTVEVAVDVDGTWVPCTPVISVEPVPDGPSLWHLAAALSAPQTSAWLANQVSGSALSRDALRVSAARLAALPLPPAGEAWDEAAAAARSAHADPSGIRIVALGRAAAATYGPVDEDLVRWWTERLPRRIGTEGSIDSRLTTSGSGD